MKLERKHRISTGFSPLAVTNLVFLLLLFFLLISGFVTPSGLPVSLPYAGTALLSPQKTSVTITSDLRYYLNDTPTSPEQLEEQLRQELSDDERILVLYADEAVAARHLVKVMDIAHSLGAKVSIAAKPE